MSDRGHGASQDSPWQSQIYTQTLENSTRTSKSTVLFLWSRGSLKGLEREGGREVRREKGEKEEGGREGGRKEGGREGGKEVKREGVEREGGKEGGREGGREGRREGERGGRREEGGGRREGDIKTSFNLPHQWQRKMFTIE